MAKRAENIVVRTESGTYRIPLDELERYRVAKSKGTLPPGPNYKVRVGKQPPIQTPGRIIFSAETRVTSG
jgi:hypothetical protein